MRIDARQNSWFGSAKISRLKAWDVAVEKIKSSRAAVFIRRFGHIAVHQTMLQRLLPHIVRLREQFPSSYYFFVRFAKRFMGRTVGVYPRTLANEVGAVTKILRGSQWNMAYGPGLAHERLENEFAIAVGARHAIAVASGGVALQMSLRAMGLKPGDEAIHQVDTCAATAMAVMNAGVTPAVADISDRTCMLAFSDVRTGIGA